MVAMSSIGVFKIGIAFDPVVRWSKADFCSLSEKTWMFMDVIHAGRADDCRHLERNLISKLRFVFRKLRTIMSIAFLVVSL